MPLDSPAHGHGSCRRHLGQPGPLVAAVRHSSTPVEGFWSKCIVAIIGVCLCLIELRYLSGRGAVHLVIVALSSFAYCAEYQLKVCLCLLERTAGEPEADATDAQKDRRRLRNALPIKKASGRRCSDRSNRHAVSTSFCCAASTKACRVGHDLHHPQSPETFHLRKGRLRRLPCNKCPAATPIWTGS